MSSISTGLSGLTQNTGTQSTTLPSWYTTAQQNVVNQAQQANAAAPTPQNTVAQNAVNALSGPTNAFTTAGNTLQSIASGAASPWTTDASGNVTPNTNTALGGLFAAENQQLNQLLPYQTAPTESANIASGNFGSLRGQTAEDTARANAQANLLSTQMQSALQNQATGVNAASGAGNVAQQNINNLLTTGQYQQSSPYTNAANLGNVLSTVQPGSTVSNTTQLSPLNSIAGLLTALTGSSGTGGILNQLGVTGGLSGLTTAIGNLFSGSNTNNNSSLSGTTSDGTSVVDTSGANAALSGIDGSSGSSNLPINDTSLTTNPV
jgi:hypothetical protein